MTCPYCKGTKRGVVDVRDKEKDDSIWRRRQCLECGERFSTGEYILPAHACRRDYKHRIPHLRQQPGLFA